jgi:hypothetical protein
MADGGIENFNGEVDARVGDGPLRRVRALVDVRFSNSMIESWWSKLKHQWLFLHRLETAAAVRRSVAFFPQHATGFLESLPRFVEVAGERTELRQREARVGADAAEVDRERLLGQVALEHVGMIAALEDTSIKQ